MTKDELITIVCEICGIEVNSLKNAPRSYDISMARHLLMWFLWWDLKIDQAEISKITYTGRSSVYRHISPQSVKDRKRSDKVFRQRFSEIKKKLT